MKFHHLFASGITLFIFTFLFSFTPVNSEFSKNQSALADTVTLSVPAGGVKVYKLDTLGLGKILSVQTSGLNGSANVQAKVDGYYNLRYEGLSPGSACCYSVRLLGNNGFRETFFRFNTLQSNQDTIRRPVTVGLKDTFELYLSSISPASIINTCEPSGIQFVNWRLVSGFTNPLKIELSGLAHGVEKHCFQICNANQSICETVTAFVTAFNKQRVNMPARDTLTTFCGQPASLCLPFTTTELVINNDYQFYVNQQPFTASIMGCNFVPTSISFNLFVLPGFGSAGPYTLERWTVNSVDYSGTFNTVAELVQMMNQWHPAGGWSSAPGLPIISGTYTSDIVGSLRIVQNSSGIVRDVQANIISVPMGTELAVPSGNYPVVLNYPFVGYADTLQLLVNCTGRTTFFNLKDTVLIGQTKEKDLDLSGLVPPYQNIVATYLDGLSADEANITFLQNDRKIRYTGVSEGKEDYWLQVCGSFNQCDTFLVEILVRDANSGEITINNPPNPTSITVTCNNVPNPPTVTATTTCNNGSVVQSNYTEQRANGSCPYNYTLTRTWNFTDNCGNQKSVSLVITVEDKTAPVFSNFPQNMNLNCGTPEPMDQPTVTDNCDPNPNVAYLRSQQNGPNPGSLIIRRQWTTTDACGNRLTQTQTINFEDTTPPIFSNIPRDTTVSCVENVQLRTPVATDACDATPLVVLQLSESPGTCPVIKLMRRTWTATDDAGNKSTVTQTITVTDLPPFLGSVNDTVQVICSDNSSPNNLFVAPTFGDFCDDRNSLSFTFSDQNLPNSCLPKNNIKRTWTVRDLCGQQTTRSQVIKYIDNISPTFVNTPPQTQILDNRIGQNFPPLQTPGATDNCSSVSVSSTTDTTVLGNNIIVENEFFASDACGNSRTFNQQITLITEPVWPGDANDDGVSSGKDLFNLGFALGKNGIKRRIANNTWTAQASINWTDNFLDGTNYKHADVDGNGLIESADTIAIKDNWGLTHPKPNTSLSLVTVPFRLDLVSFSNDGWAAFDVILGEASNPVTDFYGLTFPVAYDKSIIQENSAYIVYENSWAGNLSEFLTIQKDFYSADNFKTALVRTNKLGKNGFGKIGTFYIKIKNPMPGVSMSLTLSSSGGSGVYADQEEFDLESFQKTYDLVSSADEINLASSIAVFPNPAKSTVYLAINEDLEIKEIQLMDTQGKVLWRSFERSRQISVAGFPSGIYTLKIQTSRGTVFKKLSIER